MCVLDTVYRQRFRRLEYLAYRNGAVCNAADVVHDAFVIAVDRLRKGHLNAETTLFYPYLCTIVRHRAREQRYSDVVLEHTSEASVAPSVLTRIAAKQTWDMLTPQERAAVAQLHVMEETVSRADHGIYTSRIRVARMRLGAA